MSVQTIDIVSSSNIYFMHLRFSCPHTFLQLCCARSFDGTGNRHRSYTWVLVQALHLTHFDFYLWIFSSYIDTPSYPQLHFGLLDLAMHFHLWFVINVYWYF